MMLDIPRVLACCDEPSPVERPEGAYCDRCGDSVAADLLTALKHKHEQPIAVVGNEMACPGCGARFCLVVFTVPEEPIAPRVCIRFATVDGTGLLCDEHHGQRFDLGLVVTEPTDDNRNELPGERSDQSAD